MGVLLAWVVTREVCEFSWRADAVAVGHAEFYMDKDGRRLWRWKGQE
jgi:hypothetical protein